MSYYSKHLFMCTNDREDGSNCCQCFNAREMRKYMKDKCKDLGIHNAGQVRINSGGCMGRCGQGPVLVIYPEGIWYSFKNQTDLDEIIEQHLVNGQIVKRLQLPG